MSSCSAPPNLTSSTQRGPYAALICDLDGTLLDSNSVGPHCLNQTLSHLGLEQREPQTLRRFEGQPADKIWDEILAGQLAHRRGECDAIYREVYRRTLVATLPLYDGALAVLRQLHNAGLPVAILTNRDEEEAALLAQVTGITDLVLAVVGVSDADQAKPSAVALESTLAPLFEGVPRERILVCGDSTVDLLFARNAATRCCWARYGYGDSQQCAELGPDHIIDHLRDLPSILLGN